MRTHRDPADGGSEETRSVATDAWEGGMALLIALLESKPYGCVFGFGSFSSA